MVRRMTGSSGRRPSIVDNPYNSSARMRRQSQVPGQLHSSTSQPESRPVYRRSSVAELTRRPSGTQSNSKRSSDLEISETDMTRLLTLYNSRKVEINPSYLEEKKSKSSIPEKIPDILYMTVVVILILVLLIYLTFT